jgi:hypothetical protein
MSENETRVLRHELRFFLIQMSVDETRVLKHELVGIVGSLIQPGAYTKVVDLNI